MINMIYKSVKRAYDITNGDNVEKVRAGRAEYERWFKGDAVKETYYRLYHEKVDLFLIRDGLADCIVVFK